MKAILCTLIKTCTRIKTARLAAGRWYVAIVLLSVAGVGAAEPTFTNVTATVAPDLPDVYGASVAWGDYDNDGLLDFLLTGQYSIEIGDLISQIWRNTGSRFTNVTATVASGLPPVSVGSVAWGDYDNDGRLDFILTGMTNCDAGISQIWRNTGSGFTNVTDTVASGLQGVWSSSAAWGDYNNDGRLDFLITGVFYNYNTSGTESISQIWRNTGNGFTNVTATVAPGLPRIYASSVAWGDYDNDGWLDFLLTGVETVGGPPFLQPVSQIWRNTGSGFTNVTVTVAPGLPGTLWGSVAWGDYDNDGRLDFLVTGATNRAVPSGTISQLWRNTGSGFTNVTDTVAPGLPQVAYSSVAWGDYDNDGRLDFLLTGGFYKTNYFTRVSQLWRNTGRGFTNVTDTVTPGLPQLHAGSVAWGDYDNDGRLDFLLTGYNGPNYISQLWRNYTPLTNSPPSAPTGLAMTATTNAVMLSWNSATDGQTPASGLTYNVRAGTTPGGIDLLSAHVDATNGFRRVPALGNATLRHSLPLTGLTNGQTVYWSVQAVDTAFAGGPFVTETSVVSLPVLSVSLNSQPSTLNVSWTPPTFGWVVQQSPNLNASNWTTAASGSANPATLPATNGAQFYRLSKP